MRVHVLEIGIALVRERQIDGSAAPRRLRTLLTRTRWAEIPMRAWLIEHLDGPILVDTGQTARFNEPGYLPPENLHLRRNLRWRVTREQEVDAQLAAHGLKAADLRYTVLTHLHLDHDGGLEHVKDTEIVVTETEYRTARGLAGRLRGYLPHRWPEGFAPRTITLRDEPYGPFPRSFELARGIVLVGTPGHTRGHMSVVVEGSPRLLLAGDAAYSERTLARRRPGRASRPARARRSATMSRIRTFLAERETIFLPTHDPESPARLARYGEQHRRFRPRIVQDAQGDAVEPQQSTSAEAPRGPGDAA